MADRRDGKKRKERMFFFLLFFALAMVAAVFRDTGNVDEVWNYTFADNIASGLIPYRDFNLLQTPASCYLNALALTLFGQHLMVVRTMGALLFAAICLLLWEGSGYFGAAGIFRLLIPGAFLALFDYNTFFEYSCLIMFCQMGAMYADVRGLAPEFSLYRKPWFQAAVGVLGGIAVMSKQTYGGFVMAASWIALVAVCRLRRERAKDTLRCLFFRMLGSSLPCFLVLFSLLGTGTWDDFRDMCVTGISTFSSRHTFRAFMSEDPGKMLLALLFFLMIAGGLIYALWQRKSAAGRQAALILFYGLAGCINLYPLVNSYHISTCLIPFLWLCFPLWHLVQDLWGMRPLAWVVCLLFTGYLIGYLPVHTFFTCRFVTEIPQWEGCFFAKDEWEDYRRTEEWIAGELAAGQEVYMLDNEAAWYLGPFDRYHKYLDMFLVGNLGTKTPEECLLASLRPGSVYLLPKKNRQQYQYPRAAVTDFAEKYLQKTGEIADFEIWEPAE